MRTISAKVILVCMLLLSACATKTGTISQKKNAVTIDRPKLVVGIVVDQMRYDFLYRYWDKYGNDGFKKLVQQGFNFKNTNYSYVPTYTAPGHASIYTGSVPAVNGIVANSWYNRETGKTMYCVEDKTVKTVGSTSKAGEMSPKNLLSTTITDQLKLATNKRSKVIAVALKDRGAVIPGGYMADGAYWFDSQSGNFITSTFYREKLPDWVNEFNGQKLADKYLNQTWNTLLPIEQYTNSTADDMPYEEGLLGKDKPVFPYDLAALRAKDYELIRTTPFGNTLTKDIALKALQAEQLGKGDATDFLSVSFSSTDYIGHDFGPNSIEVEDTYIRLDREIAELLNELEKTVGTDNLLVFLTADHGVANVPAYMLAERVTSGAINYNVVGDSVKKHMGRTYGEGKWLEKYTNQQVYLNHNLIKEKKLNLTEVQQNVAQYLMTLEGVARTITADALQRTSWNNGQMRLVENGYNARRSGDVIVQLEPNWQKHGPKGTAHGSYSTHDTHVPLLWYGWKVKPGESATTTEVADIAPTIATWLNIQEPTGSVGKALQEYMK
ncbi:alkaline phosphatase family protein [Pontibacter sp. BT310]|uniref:Alkaline phosphatase family protein n=1 Tax=Pontibacter populi TaxID=890055 RepID=A0ABS6X9I1_9BACT|nr:MULTISPECIES: alkaline phosphatase PafA [Pontibacter]MBJ6117797.1 alkaline phosphatase family protein [Pontibacter sp. BT310]MBR0570223.1 alkaline phosphatase family protein [Microvirga sp. STS03]MBW3364649.1 alkaline phosphatase family protein [Pontibacter populi]